MNDQSCVTASSTTQTFSITTLSDEWDNRHLFNDFDQSLRAGNLQFVLDLSELTIINSIGINFLLRLLKRVERAGGQLILVNPSDQVLHLLEITRLTTVFSFSESVDEALEELEEYYDC